MAKLGSLLRISGHVIRSHPVHPELVRGTFMCLQCQTIVRDVPQQFKYSQVSGCGYCAHVILDNATQPIACSNPVCSNRQKFVLNNDASKFVDFQKVRIQETQQELPRGSIPRRYLCYCGISPTLTLKFWSFFNFNTNQHLFCSFVKMISWL